MKLRVLQKEQLIFIQEKYKTNKLKGWIII